MTDTSYLMPFNSLERIDDSLLCWQYDIQHIVTLLLSYATLRVIFRSYQKNDTLASNIIANFACLRFVMYGNLSHIIQYYWYDLILVVYQLNWLMIVHHLFTLYGISHCPIFVDYDKVMQILQLTKSGDILMHHYKITNALELEEKYPRLIRIYQVFTITFTCALWILYRILGIANLFPFESTKANVLIPIFVLMNIYWIFKLINLSVRIVKSIPPLPQLQIY